MLLSLSVLVVFIFAAALLFSRSSQDVKIGQSYFNLERVSSREDLIKGLSGRQELPTNSGMLFDFGSEGKRCIWMKDMNFSLDILWLSKDKEVVKLKENLSPESYPESFCSDSTKYVIELNSGVVPEINSLLGKNLKF